MPVTRSRTRKFPTEHVLCVASKSIPEAAMLPGVYKLLEHMTGGPVSTPDLSRAMNEAHRFLIFRQPHLSLPKGRRSVEPGAVRIWFSEMMKKLGTTVEVLSN